MSLVGRVARMLGSVGAIAAVCHSVEASDIELALENGKILHCDIRLYAVDSDSKNGRGVTGSQNLDIRELSALLRSLEKKNQNGADTENADVTTDTDVRGSAPGDVARALRDFVEGEGQIVLRNSTTSLAIVNEKMVRQLSTAKNGTGTNVKKKVNFMDELLKQRIRRK